MKSPSKTPIVDMAFEGVAGIVMAEKVYDKERKAVERLITPPEV